MWCLLVVVKAEVPSESCRSLRMTPSESSEGCNMGVLSPDSTFNKISPLFDRLFLLG
jgi:hypothetical protein